MQFISVVCGLAVIQKQPRLVDRAFNKLLPHTFQSLPSRLSSRPLPPFQSPISGCSLSLLLTPLLSPFSLTLPFRHSKQLLSTSLLGEWHYLPPLNPHNFFLAADCSVQGLSCSRHVQHCAQGSSLPKESEAIHISQLHAPQSHMPSGASTNKSYC